jgi:hypothetical protein
VNLARRIAALDAATRPVGGVAVIRIRHDAVAEEREAAVGLWRAEHSGLEPQLVVFLHKFTNAFLNEGANA